MGFRRSVARLCATVVFAGTGAGIGVIAAAAPAGATAAPVAITVGLDQGSIRADGRAAATLRVDVADSGAAPIPGVTVKLAAHFITAPSYGAARVAHTVLTDGAGHAEALVSSTRSGTMTITASIKTSAYVGSASTNLDARRRSVVVFANGASTTVTCPTPTTCADSTGLFDPARSALSANGFVPGDFATFSYAGGAIDPVSHEWVPAASTCEQSATSYKTEVGRMRTMLSKIASANPNTDISLVGLSQGGLLAFQMIAASPTLSKGSRIANVITFDSPLGGGPADLSGYLDSLGLGCWSMNGTSPAAQQLGLVWNTTAPGQGPQQGDRATIMCAVVGYTKCVAQTNAQAVAAVPGIAVYTWGSTQDGLFYPPLCGATGDWPDVRDSQVVTAAGGGLHAEGVSGGGTSCALLSHIAGLANHPADIAAAIGPQQ